MYFANPRTTAVLRFAYLACLVDPSYTSQSFVIPLGEQQHQTLKPRLVGFMGTYCFIAILPLKSTLASSMDCSLVECSPSVAKVVNHGLDLVEMVMSCLVAQHCL